MHAPNLSGGMLNLQYQKLVKTCGDVSGSLTKLYLNKKLQNSQWLYSKDLVGHTGCVNALAFSNNGGEFLVSGGDDTRVLIWRINEVVAGKSMTPICLKQRHESNIFCVMFNHDNRIIMSAGNDDALLCHDFESGEVFRRFEVEANTNEISFHPEDNNVFIVAESSFGAVTQFDFRTPTEQTIVAVPWPVKTLSHWPNVPLFSSAKFNPVDPTLIATGNLKNGVQLWDTRFPKRCVRRFDSKGKDGEDIVMSVAFDYTGRYIAVVRKAHTPALYHITRDTSLVEFCQTDYGNTVTRKSICFAGQKDEFVMTGSEDFNVYLWKVPKVDTDRVGTAKVDNSSLTLEGHRSIVNQACFNRDTAMICTSGVEKIIKMWSPFPMVGGIAGDQRPVKRKLYTQSEYHSMLNTDSSYDDDEPTNEDRQMLAMVDQWILQPHSPILNDSESDDEPINEHSRLDVFLEISRHSLEVAEASYDNSASAGSSPSTVTESASGRETSSEENSENITRSDINSENETISNLNYPSSINSENCRNDDRNSQISDGIELERLQEIISSQSRPNNLLRRIAELRRDCLKNED